MGGEHHVLCADQLGGGEVGDIYAQSVAVQRVDHVGTVDQSAAGEVQQRRAGLHPRQHGGVDHVAGAVHQRDVQRDVVALFQQVGQLRGVLDRAGQLPCVIHGDERVVAEHVHAQRHAHVGHQHADGAQAYYAQRLARQLGAGKLILALFHQLLHVRLTGEGLTPGRAVGDPAGGQQQTGHGQLLDRVGVGAGGVEHHHAGLGHAIQRDVVHARTGACHAQQVFVDLIAVHVGASHEDRVRIGYGRTHQIFAVAQRAVVDGGDGIQRQNIIHHAFSISNFFMNSASARTPSMGMAL